MRVLLAIAFGVAVTAAHMLIAASRGAVATETVLISEHITTMLDTHNGCWGGLIETKGNTEILFATPVDERGPQPAHGCGCWMCNAFLEVPE